MCKIGNFFLFAVVDCGALQAPANGAVMTNPGTTVGSTAAYTCDSGYLLEGEANRTCLATGSWSNTAPTCEKREILN